MRLPLVVLLAAVATAARAADPCATTSGAVSGTVSGPGGPIAGARVRVQGCLGAAVTTDATGAFSLPVPTSGGVVAAAADGHYIGCWKGNTGECATAAPGASGLAIALDALPTDDDPAHVFRPAEDCKPCHEAIYEQ